MLSGRSSAYNMVGASIYENACFSYIKCIYGVTSKTLGNIADIFVNKCDNSL